MLITISVTTKTWDKKTVETYKRVVKNLAHSLAKSINTDPERFKPKK